MRGSALLEFAGIAVLIGLAGAGLWMQPRRRADARWQWRMAWFYALLAGLTSSQAGEASVLSALGGAWILLFAALSLGGARAYAGTPAPRGLIPVSLGLAAGCILLAQAGLAAWAAGLSGALRAAALGFCALSVWNRPSGSAATISGRMLPYAFGALALAQLLAPLSLRGPGAARAVVAAWAVTAPFLVMTQIAVSDALLQRSVKRAQSQRAETERRLRQSEQRYHDHYEKSPAMFATVDWQTGCIIECNRRLSETLGHHRSRLIGMNLSELLVESSQAKLDAAIREFRTTGYVRTAELSLRRRDGSMVEAIMSAAGERNAEGRLLFARVVFRNITGLHAAARAAEC